MSGSSVSRFKGAGHPLVFPADFVGDVAAERIQKRLDFGQLFVPFPGLDGEQRFDLVLGDGEAVEGEVFDVGDEPEGGLLGPDLPVDPVQDPSKDAGVVSEPGPDECPGPCEPRF